MSFRWTRFIAGAGVLTLLCAWAVSGHAEAELERMQVLPAAVGTESGCSNKNATPASVDEGLARLARRVDGLLAEAAQDLDFALFLDTSQVESAAPKDCAHDENRLSGQSADRWVVAPRVWRDDGRVTLRLELAAPNSRVVLVRSETIDDHEVDVRTVVMLTELVRSARRMNGYSDGPEPSSPIPQGRPVVAARSSGRGVLAVTSGLLGGGVGYSLQRASGSNDPRLTYPLIALGTGIGLGASMIAADEWDISTADAWYINAGATWPTASGLLLAASYRVRPATDRYVYGLVGAASGMSLASLSLSLHDVNDGGATLTHSGGALGTFLGALTQMAILGSTNTVPLRGMGMGSGIGVLAAGAFAPYAKMSSNRVLFIDVGASLGALTAAAVGSPLLFVSEDPLPVKRQRAWLVAVGVGTLVGTSVAWYATRESPPTTDSKQASGFTWYPYVAPLPEAAGGSRTGLSFGVLGGW